MSKVLVIAPHPDDETLGCGGTLLKHKNQGDEIFCLFITNMDLNDGWDLDVFNRRQKEIELVSNYYSFTECIKLDYAAAKVDQIPTNELVMSIAKVIRDIKPEIIYINFWDDVHTDHKVIFQAAYSCTKSFRYPYVKEVLVYETLSETDYSPPNNSSGFIPNYFVDISDTMEDKLSIMEIYKSQVMNNFGPRSLSTIRALNRYRGSRINVEYAEAFMLLHKSR